jgi:hypothetical protein
MSRKFTFEEANEIFNQCGYRLEETVYVNSQTPMRYTCPNHLDKETYITVTDLRRGVRCKYCSGNAKHTIEFAREQYIKRGFELLEDIYINSHVKMRFRCPHHPDKNNAVSLSWMMRGIGCPHCSGIASPEFDKVKQCFDDRGYILLTREYINAYGKLEYICPKHPDSVLTSNWHEMSRDRAGCRKCADEANRVRFRRENSHFWKGGVTELNNYLRQLLDTWKKVSFETHEYKCFVTGLKGDVEVHHIIPHNIIRDRLLQELGFPVHEHISSYTSEQLIELADKWIDYHNRNLGIPLLRVVHQLFHSLYGHDTTYEDLIEFRERYASGEFNEAI